MRVVKEAFRIPKMCLKKFAEFINTCNHDLSLRLVLTHISVALAGTVSRRARIKH